MFPYSKNIFHGLLKFIILSQEYYHITGVSAVDSKNRLSDMYKDDNSGNY